MADKREALAGKLKEREAQKQLEAQKKAETKKKAAMLGAELDQLLVAEKERQAAVSGEAIETNFVLYQTLYEYTSEDPDDLEFKAGEILRVFDEEGDWFEGENQEGQKGCFPSTFVRKIKMQGQVNMPSAP